MLLRLPFFLILLLFSSLSAQEASPKKLQALYYSLDPTSISQHLAFHELYPNSKEGQQSLQDALRLLTNDSSFHSNLNDIPTSLASSLNAIVSLVNKLPNENNLELSDTELSTIEKIANRLPNRRLPGFSATTEEDVLKLTPEQIDITRGILLTQLGDTPDAMRKIRSYEAAIDLMAIQILARVSIDAPPTEKIKVINRYIFEEMGFRFPPHSTYAKDIDLYTFLPSVLDSRRGVCLGVSILYLCLAQRLNLNLEIVTPPGHIFVRWRKGDDIINIETTARGIDLPSEEYLGINTRSLKERDIKETIGMAHFNQASVYWEHKKYDQAMASYVKAQKYLPNEKFVLELMGYISLLLGETNKGKELLKQVVDYIPDDAVSKHTISEDFLNGNASADGIAAIFMHVDEDRESLIEKRQALEKTVQAYPRFREALFSLAGTWLQLYRSGEALDVLNRYHALDPTNATVEYYLAALNAERLDYNKAWEHYEIAEKLVKTRNHDPEALTDLRQQLTERCPNPRRNHENLH